ncbi:PhoH family protein [Coprobacter tertius]|uniref:PhoH family protein n=1 Tax=Coprobacter tertius TaxID=2944915 RepID=A0ABT1MGS1_9BACT|nr:PhoH family protein [Coprobacter tertius]MCP9611837.1 PhoH family protein [Coprobacter tertius]
MGSKKNFVLDTNVILHDYKCLFNFQDNDIYLPIVVLEELDKFKKGNDQINFNAREFVRELDEITDEQLFSKGANLGPDLGKLSIIVNSEFPDEVKNTFPTRIPDHQILAATLNLARKHPSTKTILVTKDVNLRMKARSLGIITEDYTTDKVMNIDIFESEQRQFEIADGAVIDEIYKSHEGVPVEKLGIKEKLKSNECFILNSGTSSVLARYVSATGKVKKVVKERNFGIEPRNAEQSFAFELLNDPNVKLLALTGKAGTGKTLLALAGALKQSHDYKQILLARPIVALANKDLGFLPGDEKQKIAPYMQPLFDNLNVIKHQFTLGGSDYRYLQDIQEKGQLVIEALAYIRGRSLSETFCIIDEAQNLTPHEIKTIITRAGEGTKMVFTGDIQQIDSPYLDSQSNGLVYMIDKMQGQNIFGHVNLVKGERSELSELASNLL